MRACLPDWSRRLPLHDLDDYDLDGWLVAGWWQSSFDRWEMCPTSCLNRRLVGGPVWVLSIGFHMHKMGTSGEVLVGGWGRREEAVTRHHDR